MGIERPRKSPLGLIWLGLAGFGLASAGFASGLVWIWLDFGLLWLILVHVWLGLSLTHACTIFVTFCNFSTSCTVPRRLGRLSQV